MAAETPLRDLSNSKKANRADRAFSRVITGAAFTSLIILAGITIFLGAKAVPVIQDQGLSFLTTTVWDTIGVPPEYGIAGMLYGSILLAVIALVIAVPVSIFLAVFMVFIAPTRVSKFLTNLVDLMAAIPSVIIGLWAFYVLVPSGTRMAVPAQPISGLDPNICQRIRKFHGNPFHCRCCVGNHDDSDCHIGYIRSSQANTTRANQCCRIPRMLNVDHVAIRGAAIWARRDCWRRDAGAWTRIR